ncbi:hypothetical protein TanjilG_07073 [Lupinus angustifolius]|uniref:Uncharacterized protein n=1 Tax=Lupinus angustifolius TaxID=3871 RepID=A0A4P1QXN1_LUPAN|nr:hypothetical protein TanjilG_07073 [Lupinus angustifolius]
MLCEMQSHSLHTFTSIKLPLPTFTLSTTSSSPISHTLTLALISKPKTLNTPPFNQSLSLPPIAKNLGFRPTSEFGILSQFFVLSMAFGAFFAVALVSIPTMIAFRRLEASMKKLSIRLFQKKYLELYLLSNSLLRS